MTCDDRNWNQPGWPIFYFGIPVFWTSTYAFSSWVLGNCKRIQVGTEEGALAEEAS